MRKLDFKKIVARNFMCFGSEGIELHFNNYGNVVLVRGENLDAEDKEARVASNGVGKSTLIDILVYALYGKGVKKLKQAAYINNQVGKHLYTEVIWDKYRVVRTRETDSLKVWESEEGIWNENTLISPAGIPAAQNVLDEKLGISYDAFVNIVVFTDNNSTNFLECTKNAKRDVIDDLFSLYLFRVHFENTKDTKNETKTQIKTLAAHYEQLLEELDLSKTRLNQAKSQEVEWKRLKKEELIGLLEKLQKRKATLVEGDEGKLLAEYNKTQGEIEQLKDKIPKLEEKERKVQVILVEARSKLETTRESNGRTQRVINQHKNDKQTSEHKIEESAKLIKSLADKGGTKCPTCYGIVDESNYAAVIDTANNAISEHQPIIVKLNGKIEESTQKFNRMKGRIDILEAGINQCKIKISKFSTALTQTRQRIKSLAEIKKPEIDTQQEILEKQITELHEQTDVKKAEIDGPSPYVQIIQTSQEEVEKRRAICKERKEELAEAEDDLLYWEFLAKAFDKEIRKFVISDILPTLNARVEYWLQVLMDGKLELLFDNELEETIQRVPSNGNPFIYPGLSGGQRRLLNLAVSQAFAHIMVLSSGTMPSMVFLDEIDLNVDPVGVVAIYRMIQELARDKQVFITTHDQDLLQLLQGHDTLDLEMKDGFTCLV